MEKKRKQETSSIGEAGATLCGPGYHQHMIARHWRGWTKLQDADKYEELLKTKILPGVEKIKGYRGGYILRHDAAESEFVVVNLFDSLDSVRQFAGSNYAVPVFEPDAKRLLTRFDSIANHYDVRVDTGR
jgi:heme-degrading monooxygenase HmoA